ncbi:MAG: replicative DNA helicase [Rickettsiales bacterium]|nr:replicative DNA helicase [Rickettsiales bacterium]
MEHLQNLEIEQQILGLTIQNKSYFDKIEDVIKVEYFSIPFHQKLFEKITEIRKTTNSDGLILVFLNQYFIEEERQAIVSMIHEASTFANIRDYAFSLIDLYQKRETLKAFEYFQNSIIETKYDVATSELLDKIAKLDNENQDNAKISTLEEIEKEIASETKEDLHLPTGFKKLDEVLNGGLRKGNLTVLGARPAVGKTSWCQQVILNIAKQGKVCLFASLEVNNRQVYDKFVSINKSVPAWKIFQQKLNQSELIDYNKSKQELKEINDFIFVVDASQSIKQIEAMVRRHIAKRKLDLLVVDYIQIVKREYSKNISEATAIKEITTGLKQIAKKYNIAVLGLAQINREGVNGKEPTMNDLKGSGGIEEDADCIILLHRPVVDNEFTGLSPDGTFRVAKNRWGATKNIKFSFNGQITTFFEDL